MQKQQITNRIRNTNMKFILEVIKCMNYGLGEKEKDYIIQQANIFFCKGRKTTKLFTKFHTNIVLSARIRNPFPKEL